MPRRSLRYHLLTAALALVVSVGCGETGVLNVVRPHRVRLRVDRADALINEAFAFQLEVSGTRLVEVQLQYGDGQSLIYPAFGAYTLAAKPKHAYAAAGTYQVSALAQVESGAIVRDSLQVVVRQ